MKIKYSRTTIRRYLRASDTAPMAPAKGALLETLAKYLFSKIAGVSFHDRNVLDGPRAHELDVVFWNNQPKSDLFFLGAVIIVECKNTGHPVSARDVGWYVRKLQDNGCDHGILLALSGITGERDGRNNAYSEVIGALTRDRIRILVLSRGDILSLRQPADLVRMLKQKLLQLTLRRVVE